MGYVEKYFAAFYNVKRIQLEISGISRLDSLLDSLLVGYLHTFFLSSGVKNFMFLILEVLSSIRALVPLGRIYLEVINAISF